MSILLSLGIVFALFGVSALLAQSGSCVEYRLMHALRDHGVDGEAVFRREEYASGSKNRMYFDVRLSDGEVQAEFHEYMSEVPGPAGTVVSAVYDARNPKRARTGLRKDLDFEKEWPVVLLLGGGGLMLLGVGVLLCVIDATV